jgi:ribosome maturation factor RimP
MSGGSRHAAALPDRLADLLEPVISAAGLELESLRVGRVGRRSLLRIVVDAEQGVTLDDIALVSRAVAAEVDASDALGPGSYTLEVSSPGVDRPLTEPRHWRRASGRLVRVCVGAASSRTADAGQSRTVEGRVVAAGPAGVTLELDGTREEFGYAELGPGQVQVEFRDLAEGVQPDGH